MQNSLIVEEGVTIKFLLVPFAACLLPLQLKVISNKKKLNSHIGEINEDQIS